MVQEDQYNDLGIDFDLKQFTVTDFGNTSACSATMSVRTVSAADMNSCKLCYLIDSQALEVQVTEVAHCPLSMVRAFIMKEPVAPVLVEQVIVIYPEPAPYVLIPFDGYQSMPIVSLIIGVS